MSARVIELTEYEPCVLQADELTDEVGHALHSSYSKQIQVEPPTFLNGNCWRLTPQGWVGYIPLSDECHFSLVPKVPISNLFRMLEYAYRLDFKLLEGLTHSDSIADVYERLALVLAKRVLDRLRRGLYRSYIREDDELPFVRGRIDVLSHLRNPMRVKLPCQFEDHTPDLEENQILLWTLTRILEGGVCSDQTLPHIRQARRALQAAVASRPFSPQDCVGRLYNRLNEDYEPLHALCRFFLEHTGPTHEAGDRRMLPILVDMGPLFELFVSEWLKTNLPTPFSILSQENVTFQMGHQVTIRIDITISDVSTGKTVLVLDTKYKAPERPAATDMQAVVAYAEAKGCEEAILVYPTQLAKPVDGHWGRHIRLRSLAYTLDGNLEDAGAALLRGILESCYELQSPDLTP